jgi:hypothetical protein
MTLEHDLLQLARDAMRSLMLGREFAVGQTGHYLNIIRRIEDELNRPKPEQASNEPPDYVEPPTSDYHNGWEAGFEAAKNLFKGKNT